MKKLDLSGIWQGKCFFPDASFEFSGKVPGSSIADLIAAGRLPSDIFYRDNCEALTAYEECDYEYKRSFTIEKNEDTDYVLKLEKLDTYAEIFINGESIAKTKNAFIAHTFDVTDKLVPGENEIAIYFTSPISAVRDMPRHAGAFTTERMNTRRIQCTYGWDWVARFIGVGITGCAEILAYERDKIHIESAYIYTKSYDEDSADVVVDLNFKEGYGSGIVNISILSPCDEVVYSKSRYCNEPLVRFNTCIPRPELWYPLGYGEHPVYTLVVSDEDGKELHREIFGIRVVKITELPDAKGSDAYLKCKKIHNERYDLNEDFSGFILKINGKRIFCRGANFVPPEPFRHTDTDKKITELLDLASEMGLNMIRIWGGGDFGSEYLLDECSKRGIMVTQDFLMACGKYPEDEDWFIEELRREAEYAALRLRNKPSLMWWSGDNENAVNGKDTDEDYQGRRSAFFGIASVLYRLDPMRVFLPSSPYGGNKYASNTVGTTHNTQYLGCSIIPYMLSGKCDDYREFWKTLRARFVAEEPQLGAVSRNSLLRIMTEDDINDESADMLRFHMKTNPGLHKHLFDMQTEFTESVLGGFTSMADRLFKLKYIQYEWIRLTMEQARREAWFTSGMIYWMLNDCWPASSGWAIIDYYNMPKDAFYAFRRTSQRIVLSFDKEDGKYDLYASNLGDAALAKVTVRKLSGSHSEIVADVTADIAAEGVTKILSLNEVLDANEILVADIEADGICDRTFYKQGALNISKCDVNVVHNEDEMTVTLSSDKYVHAVELEGAIFSDSCFSLLPGESKTVSYRKVGDGAIEVTAYTVTE